MLKESYNYGEHPDLNKFKSFLRTPSETHPSILQREKEIAEILSQTSQLDIPIGTSPSLLPSEADQGLVLTPFDKYTGMRVEIPTQHLEAWKILSEYNLQLANHPARIQAMKVLEKNGFSSLPWTPGVIDKILESGRIPQLADLGHAPDLVPDYQISRQTHRTELLATGPFTLIKGKAFNYIGGGAMPDIFGSVLACTTAAKMFTTVGIPEVGLFSDPHNQAALAEAALSCLTENDPLIVNRDQAEKQYIADHWRSCITGVLEVNTAKALKRAELLTQAGVTSFRIYGHTRGRDIVNTVRALRKEHPNAIIYAGQISDIDIAQDCEQAGADALVLGVGGGGRCTTAALSELIPTMAPLAWKLRRKVTIPLVGEGGVIDNSVTAALVGYSMVNGSGSIGGGTFEAPGGLYFLTLDGKTYFKPYRGEASPSMKWLSKRTYGTGLPFIPEGESKFKPLIPLQESMTQKILTQMEKVILGAVVLGADAGPFLIQTLQEIGPHVLFEKTRTAQIIQNTH